MELRLYKNCKLTQEYDNVFNSKSVFESYLETLDATAYDISLETSYYSVQSDGTGSIPIDFNYVSDGQILGHINEYNYIRFTDSNYNIVRYCFVTTIAIQNGIAIINYLEDVWHNYVFGTQISRCIISQRRSTGDYPAKNIIDYEGNSAPNLYTYSQSGLLTSDQLMVVKFQLYKTAQSGEITERYPLSGVIFYEDTDNVYSTNIYPDRNNIADFLYKSAQKTDSVNINGRIYPGVETGNYNIDITDIYIVPKKYLSYTYNLESGIRVKFNESIELSTTEGSVTLFICKFTVSSLGLTNTVSYKPFENQPPEFGYKTIAIGNYSMSIPFSYNGVSDTEVKVYFKTDIKSFALFYSINNQLVEITECYNYNYPINIETAENLQLQKINRKLENDTYERNKGALVADTFRGVASASSGIISIASGNVGGGIQSIVNGATEPVDSFIQLKNSQQRLTDITNASLYVSNSGVSATSNAVLNADVDLLLYQINPVNELIVNNISSAFGKVCNIFIQSLINGGEIGVPTTMSYEYFIISKCDITGNAPDNVLIMIKNILKRGVRVWRVNTL